MTEIPQSVRQRMAAQTTQAWSVPDVVDLGIGQPADAILPYDIMAKAAALASKSSERHCLQYGTERGDGYLRLALAEFLGANYRIPVDPEPIFITNGNSQAIDLVCSVFARPGDVVFVEEPSYFLAIDIFRQHGLQIVGIPVDADGMSIEALERELQQRSPAFVYTIPAFHNPTGTTLSQARRERLVTLATKHDFLIVADEVYQLLDYVGAAPAPMAAYVDSGKVLSLGTFSKILAPGLRLGWIQAEASLIDRLASQPYVVSGGGLNPFTASMVRIVIEQGWLAEYLESLRRLFRERIEVMDSALRSHMRADVEFTTPTGGYFYWLRFPDGTDTTRFLEPAIALGVGFRAGPKFSVAGGQRECLRLSFAFYDAETIARVVPLLARATTAP
jgi:DNA-binding transcriptional MocR family regulator